MRRSVWAMTLLVTGCSALGGHGPAATASRQMAEELRAADAARGRALRSGDTAALGRLYADDFVMITSTGQLRTKADQLRDIGAGAVEHRGPEDQILKLTLHGDVAVVHAESAAGTLVTDGRPDPHARRYTRVYVHRAGRWQLLATPISVLADSAWRLWVPAVTRQPRPGAGPGFDSFPP